MTKFIALLAAFAFSATACAQAPFPNREIRLLVAFAPGSTSDITMRIIAEKLGPKLGKTAIVENRPGGNYTVAVNAMMAAPADGHTYMATSPSAVIRAVAPDARFDVLRDFAPIYLWGRAPLIMIGGPSSKAKNMAEFIAYAKAKKDKINFGVIGLGSQTQLIGLLVAKRAGFEVTSVSYTGSAQTSLAVAAGQVDASVEGYIVVKPMIDAGRIQALAVSSAKRFPFFPGIAGMEESGIRNVDAYVWWGLVGRAGTPPAIIDTMHKALADIFNDPGFRKDFETRSGLEYVGDGPAAFRKTLADETTLWKQIIEENNIVQQ